MPDLRQIAPDDDGIRLDRWFKRHYPQLKHGRLEKLLRTGQIRVDGGRAKANQRLTPGQVIRIPPLDTVGAAPAKKGKPVSARDAAARMKRNPYYVGKLYAQARNFTSDELAKALDGCIVDCPLHSGRFDLASGDCVQWPTTGGLGPDGEEHPVEPGSFVYVPGGTPHFVRNLGPETLKLLYVFAVDRFSQVEYVFPPVNAPGDGRTSG